MLGRWDETPEEPSSGPSAFRDHAGRDSVCPPGACREPSARRRRAVTAADAETRCGRTHPLISATLEPAFDLHLLDIPRAFVVTVADDHSWAFDDGKIRRPPDPELTCGRVIARRGLPHAHGIAGGVECGEHRLWELGKLIRRFRPHVAGPWLRSAREGWQSLGLVRSRRGAASRG